MPQQVQRILFIRLSAIGDIVMASGLPSSINSIYTSTAPNIEITWLVEAPYTGLVSAHPHVNNVIAWPKSEWKALAKRRQYWQLVKAVWKLRQELRSYRFTVAVEAQGLLKSALLAFLSGAPVRFGFKSKENSHLLLTHVTAKPMSDEISSEYGHLAKFIADTQQRDNADNVKPYQLQVRVLSSVNASAFDKLSLRGITQPFMVIAPFTTRPQKHWPMEHWETLLEEIRKHTQMPIVILGGPSDAAHAESLTFGQENIVSLAGNLTLEESVAIASKCHALVGVDTGLTHLGTVFNKPTVAIFGSTRPYIKTDSANTHIIYKELSCAPCKRRPTCGGKFDCMKEVTPKEVLNRLLPYINY
ncbi:glycosyltransferase family 9 protein [Alteromonas gracilis]|uniref:Glycosyltransferase family 9 protein n=1 Tax=Alteromonas gracilis TaxID=1479524 RepID=A0ABX5CS20_9ALTE|nr:glycosyltransferase family 9 protein [Alteromonas gracilis]PRO69702.1 glycosyltransferase family 9 protein [Alteromonas gracilis]